MTAENALLELARAGFRDIDVTEEVKSRALSNLRRWLEEEQFAEARPQIEYLFEAEDFNNLFDSYFQQIPFGTGGRRGPVGFGTNRINPFTIATSIQGHCRFLEKHHAGNRSPSVVIAYDVRVYQDLRGVYDPRRSNPLLGKTSHDFARIAAEVYAANGVQVWFPDAQAKRFVSTPELSFTIRHLGAAGGLNVSASHNHPDDNGAKVYNETGGQEIPPLDEEMANIVETVDIVRSMAWEEAIRRGLIRWIPAEAYQAYIDTNAALTIDPKARSARVVFTPLNGTGWSSVGATLKRCGFEVECLPEQEQPDGLFPSIPFRSPNPEVRESLDAATEFARRRGADLVLATDPDADRLGMVAPDTRGNWIFLNGNEIGILLAAYLLSGNAAPKTRKRPFAATTVVTTSLFSRIAAAHGVQIVNDLAIGFKYIANLLRGIEERGRYLHINASIDDFSLAIEESHGYLVTPKMRDKDAAGAALLLAELASRLKNEGRSLHEYLDSLYRRYGYVRNKLVSTVMLGAPGFLNIRKIQQSLRDSPPTTVSNLEVVRFIDRWDESGPLGTIVSETDRTARDLLTFELEGSARIILRPSGTESKNKIYVEVCAGPLGESAADEALERHKEEIDSLATRIAQDFCLAMLERIDVRLPRYALEISDLVPLECKRDFADSFLPELVERLERGDPGPDLERWVDARLQHYGADGRLLVHRAVEAYCRAENPDPEVVERLRELFITEGAEN